MYGITWRHVITVEVASNYSKHSLLVLLGALLLRRPIPSTWKKHVPALGGRGETIIGLPLSQADPT